MPEPGGTLADLGERRIVREILEPRYTRRYVGDDCAIAEIDSGWRYLALTTDPCPEPMAALLGFTDPFYRGWLFATINLSDLAAAGARPLGLLASMVLPRDYLLRDFMRLLDGMDACCSAAGTRVIGGNLKEGQGIDLVGSAVGTCGDWMPLQRAGAHPSDVVVVIGDMGLFWTGVLASQNHLLPPVATDHPLLRTVLTPIPKVAVGVAAAQQSLLSSCMDNSDGLPPTVSQLASSSGVRFELDLSAIEFDSRVTSMAQQLALDPVRLALGWGDWQLVGTVSPTRLSALQRLCHERSVELHIIGQVQSGSGVGVYYNGRRGTLAPLESERFAANSWFTAGLDTYIEALKENPVVE